MAKFTKQKENSLKEFISLMDHNGVLSVDQWTSGTGRHTTNRAMPPFVMRYANDASGKIPPNGTPERAAFDYFTENKRRKYCLVLDKGAMYSFLFECANCREY